MLFGDAEKEVLRRMIWKVADFSGVEVMTYCVMSNHFHVLVRVPDANSVQVSDEELMRRYEVLYPKPTNYQEADIAVMKQTLMRGGSEAEKIRNELLSRMHNVSEYMKCLKQRFSVWFNKSHGRYGTLWAERYKSVLVQNEKFAKLTVAAYIDLNPVRAGIVEDPKDYRFSSYGEAVSGSVEARKGLGMIIEDSRWDSVQRSYRMLLYSKGAAPDKHKAGGSVKIIDQEAADQVFEEGGRLEMGVVLRSRINYFTQGEVLGNERFVAGYIEANGGDLGRKREVIPKSVEITCLKALSTLCRPKKIGQKFFCGYQGSAQSYSSESM
jgi:REP element-mobilizing transposase RayT